jgi:hypothetical protein
LNTARAKEKLEIAEQRAQLRQEQQAAALRSSPAIGIGEADDDRLTGIASARGLLKFLLD